MYRPSRRRTPFLLSALVALSTTSLVACGNDTTRRGAATCLAAPTSAGIDPVTAAKKDVRGTEITLVTHDSFAVSKGLLDAFTKESGITVTVLKSGDAGQLPHEIGDP